MGIHLIFVADYRRIVLTFSKGCRSLALCIGITTKMNTGAALMSNVEPSACTHNISPSSLRRSELAATLGISLFPCTFSSSSEWAWPWWSWSWPWWSWSWPWWSWWSWPWWSWWSWPWWSWPSCCCCCCSSWKWSWPWLPWLCPSVGGRSTLACREYLKWAGWWSWWSWSWSPWSWPCPWLYTTCTQM